MLDITDRPRDAVHAFVCGEHGAAQVPLWSSVRVQGVEPTAGELARLRGRSRGEDFAEELKSHQARVRELLELEKVGEAFAAVKALQPDLRAAIEPFVTFHCLHSTPNATANATCDVLRALRSGREAVVGAQIRLEGEFRDLRTTLGLPVLVDAGGWRAVVCPVMTSAEARQLESVADTLRQNLAQWTASGQG